MYLLFSYRSAAIGCYTVNVDGFTYIIILIEGRFKFLKH